jgi:hypothetical protein
MGWEGVGSRVTPRRPRDSETCTTEEGAVPQEPTGQKKQHAGMGVVGGGSKAKQTHRRKCNKLTTLDKSIGMLM